MKDTIQKQILVVEDNPDISNLLYEVLSEAGYKVVCTKSADEGLHILTRLPGPTFHLITLDLGLPGMSGIAFLEELSRHTEEACKVPVVVVSANLQHFKPSPQVKGVIGKPFDLQKLLATINLAA